MDNNKNRLKDRPKSNAELRKMYFEHGSEIGIENGMKIGAKDSGTSKIKKQNVVDIANKVVDLYYSIHY